MKFVDHNSAFVFCLIWKKNEKSIHCLKFIIKIHYLQRFKGACLISDTRKQSLIIWEEIRLYYIQII